MSSSRSPKVLQFSKSLQYFQEMPFDPNPGLHSFYLSHELRSANDTHVPWYTYTRFGQ